jgi:hypothetical protein
MEDAPVKIELKTSDKSLFNDLAVEKIPGVKVGMRMGFTDCAECTPVVDAIVTLTITIIGGSAGSLLASFLKERFINKVPEIATINNQSVVNNIENIAITINNVIENSRQDSETKGQ